MMRCSLIAAALTIALAGTAHAGTDCANGEPDLLSSGEYLSTNGVVQSCGSMGGTYGHLGWLQDNGDFAAYHLNTLQCDASQPIVQVPDPYYTYVYYGCMYWHTNTAGSGAVQLYMNPNGDYELRNSNGTVVWHTNTATGVKGRLSTTSNLGVFDQYGNVVWGNP